MVAACALAGVLTLLIVLVCVCSPKTEWCRCCNGVGTVKGRRWVGGIWHDETIRCPDCDGSGLTKPTPSTRSRETSDPLR